ncbi:hypothetical protein AAMO2058_000301800 [Amorphochlora amoebiformis]
MPSVLLFLLLFPQVLPLRTCGRLRKAIHSDLGRRSLGFVPSDRSVRVPARGGTRKHHRRSPRRRDDAEWGRVASDADMRKPWEDEAEWDRFSSKFANRVADARTKQAGGSVRVQRGIGEEGEHFYSSCESFTSLNLSSATSNALRQLGINRPSKIQKIAIPALLEGHSAIIGEQTGSGKTLAYLLPVIERVVEMERKGEIPRWPRPKKPRIVVVTPTSELAAQVKAVAYQLSQVLDFRTICVTRDRSANKLSEGVDLLVSTPGSLMYLINTHQVILSDVQSLVIDEADILFLDKTFPTDKLLSKFAKKVQPKSESDGIQYVFVSATFPPRITQQIQSTHPDALLLTGPGLHRVSPAVDFALVDCTYRGNGGELPAGRRGARGGQADAEKMSLEIKKKALVEQLRANPAERTLIFCNTIQTCRDVENYLSRRKTQKVVIGEEGEERKGVGDELGELKVLAFHSAIDPAKQKKNFGEFIGKEKEKSKDKAKKPRNLKSGVSRSVLISTGRASKGFDFGQAAVDHVIMFDWPRDNIEVVRRIGRTGRAGRHGRVTLLVRGQQAAVAKRMMEDWRVGRKLDASFAEWDSFKKDLDEESLARSKDRQRKKAVAEARAAQTGWGGREAERWEDFSDVSSDSDDEFDNDEEESFPRQEKGRFQGRDGDRQPQRNQRDLAERKLTWGSPGFVAGEEGDIRGSGKKDKKAKPTIEWKAWVSSDEEDIDDDSHDTL